VPIIRKHREAVLVDFRVGRIDVDRIDLLLRDRFIREAMIEPARRREG
jgi:HD superfamily phosphohydrolase